MFHSQHHPSSMSTPLSFADLLCASASDVIDWAPPGRVTTWNHQIQTAARRSDNDRAEARLRHSARSNGSGSQLDANHNATTTTTTTTSSGSGGDVGASCSGEDVAAANGGHVQQRAWWSRGVVHGLFGAQSHFGVKLYDTDQVFWSAEATTAVSLSGLPLSFDAGWRANTDVTWVPRRWRLLLQGQWTTPLDIAPDVLHVQLQTPRNEVAFRADKHLYLLSQCANWTPSSSSRLPGRQRQQEPPPPAAAVTAVGSSLWNACGILQRYVASVRGGFGLAIKNDLGSGVNLFTGVAVKTAGGLTASYHVDVLRRLTLSVSQRSAYQHEDNAAQGRSASTSSTTASSTTDGGEAAGSQSAIVTALRLKLNTITYQGTALDVGIDMPLAAVVRLFQHGRGGGPVSSPLGHTTEEEEGSNSRHAAAATSRRPMVDEALAFLQRHPIGVHCSHSSVGSMVGIRWHDVQKVLPQRVLRLVGDVRLDVTAGVVAKRLVAGGGLPPMVGSNNGVAGGSRSSDASASTVTTSIAGDGSSSMFAATGGGAAAGDSARFASAHSNNINVAAPGGDGVSCDNGTGNQGLQPLGSPQQQPCGATVRRPVLRNVALASFLLVSFE